MTHAAPIIDRLMKWSKFDPKSRCIVWHGSLSRGGYGRLSIKGNSAIAHRLVYKLAYGKIPKGKEIDHRCRNRLCINPFHLEAVTRWQNMARGLVWLTSGIHNSEKTHCKHGHAFNSENTRITRAGTRRCKVCEREVWNQPHSNRR